MEGFPVIKQINFLREECYKNSHAKQSTFRVKSHNWISHKALSAIAIPANLLGMGAGAVGAVVSGCTLGAIKVAIFAATVGNVKPKFPSGFVWCAEGSLVSLQHLLFNAGELIHDIAQVVEKTTVKAYKGTRWMMKTLYIDKVAKIIFCQIRKIIKFVEKKIGPVFKFFAKKIAFVAEKVAHAIEKAVCFIGKRLSQGWQKAIEAEKGHPFKHETPSFLNFINKPTENHRIDFNSEGRSWKKIFNHTLLSGPNILLNGVTAIGASLALAPLSLVFTGKATLYAATNMNIPVPTYINKVFQAAIYSTGNVFLDFGNDVADGAVTVFKTSKALGIHKVMTTALGVILYIPEAIFS
jgi:hypothetical protein